MPNCNQAEADALSVNAVSVQGGVTDEESQSDEEEELVNNSYSYNESKVRTKLKIQNNADVINDITDLGWTKRQKIKLRHINEPKDGQIQELEALIRTRNVPVVANAGDATNRIASHPEEYINDSEKNQLGPTQQISNHEKHTFDQYYKNLIGIAKYLDIRHLNAAQRFDPFWRTIIEQLDTQ